MRSRLEVSLSIGAENIDYYSHKNQFKTEDCYGREKEWCLKMINQRLRNTNSAHIYLSMYVRLENNPA